MPDLPPTRVSSTAIPAEGSWHGRSNDCRLWFQAEFRRRHSGASLVAARICLAAKPDSDALRPLRARGNAAGGTWRFTWMMRFGAGRACNGRICWPTISTNCTASPRRSASICCRIKVRRGPRFPITISRRTNGAAPSREGQLHVVATRSSRFCAGRDPPTTLTCVPSRNGHLAGLTAGFAREPARSFPASLPLASGLQSSRWRSDPASYPHFYAREHIANGEQTVYIAPRCCSLLVFRITVIRSGSNGYGCATSR